MNTTEILHALANDLKRLKPPVEDSWAYLAAVKDVLDLIRTYEQGAALVQLRKPDLKTLVEQFRQARELLVDERIRRFPIGAEVRVKSPRYAGPGERVRDPHCPPDMVPVMTPNGNTHWYPIEDVEVV